MPKIEGVPEFLHHDPIGTVEDVKKSGLDLQFVGSCSPGGGATAKVRGCQFYDTCPFGFRDNGPKHVAVRIVKPKGAIKEMDMPCFRWMRSYHDRAMAGLLNAEVYGDETKKGCVIAVTGSEPRFPDDPKSKARKKFAKEMPIPKFPSIEEAFPEEVQSARVLDSMAARRSGQKIFKSNDAE